MGIFCRINVFVLNYCCIFFGVFIGAFFGDYMLCYVIYVVIYWMEFLPSYYYYGKKSLRIYDLIWSNSFFYIDFFWYLSLIPEYCLICIILLFRIVLLLSFDFFLIFVFLMKRFLFLLLLGSIVESLRSESFSLFATYLLIWINRDLIIRIFSPMISSSSFLVPEEVCSIFLLYKLISVVIDVLLLSFLLFPNFLPRTMISFPPVLIFSLLGHILNLIRYYWY